MTNMKTLDTDFAAAMMLRGARLDGWERSPDGRKLYWVLREIDPTWIQAYADGRDGILKFSANRRMLVNVCKTELKS